MLDNDKPEQGKQYVLIGDSETPCIANGNTWAESEVQPPPPLNGYMPKMWRSRDGYNYIVEQLELGQYTHISQWAAYHGFCFYELKRFYDEDNDLENARTLTDNLDVIRSIKLLGNLGYLSELITKVLHSTDCSARDRCPACGADDFTLPPKTLCKGCRESDTYMSFINRQTEL